MVCVCVHSHTFTNTVISNQQFQPHVHTFTTMLENTTRISLQHTHPLNQHVCEQKAATPDITESTSSSRAELRNTLKAFQDKDLILFLPAEHFSKRRLHPLPPSTAELRLTVQDKDCTLCPTGPSRAEFKSTQDEDCSLLHPAGLNNAGTL